MWGRDTKGIKQREKKTHQVLLDIRQADAGQAAGENAGDQTGLGSMHRMQNAGSRQLSRYICPSLMLSIHQAACHQELLETPRSVENAE